MLCCAVLHCAVLCCALGRTENPWEANMFWIPAMTYAYSENTGNTVRHSKRAVDYVRQHWPFFNR